MNASTIHRILKVGVPIAIDLAIFVLEEINRQRRGK
jgi:hypothetical protein